MNETSYAELLSQAVDAAEQLQEATSEERAAILSALADNNLVVRNTIIRDHLQGCQNHFNCGWQDVQDPSTPRNEDSWATRSALVVTARDAIREGHVNPWLPEVRPTVEQLSNASLFPFYRAR